MKRMTFFFVSACFVLMACWTGCGPEVTTPSEKTEAAKEAGNNEPTGKEGTTEAAKEVGDADASTPEETSEPLPEPTVEKGQEPTVPETVAEETPTEKDYVWPEKPTLGDPIKADPDKWTWVDIKGAKCGYGTDTGFAINPHTDTTVTQLLIHMQGGGACWSDSGLIGNCYGIQPTATNLKGYDAAKFKSDSSAQGTIKSFFFQRGNADNVFAKAHYVFIPHCTGDVYSGNAEVTFPNGKKMHFVGHRNMKLYFARIAATFPNLKHVVLTGSSAGGFGAAINWGLVQFYFGDKVRVDLIDDSGPPMPPAGTRWQQWTTTWKTVMPPGCPAGCKTNIFNIIKHYDATMIQKGRKMAFLSTERDSVIRAFFGMLDANGDQFKTALYKLLGDLDTINDLHYYVIPGNGHTMFSNATSKTNSQNVKLTDWIKAMVTDDASWKSYHP